MDRHIHITGIASVICSVVGGILTSIMVAFVSVQPSAAHAITFEQGVSVGVCLTWFIMGMTLMGMWMGYRAATAKAPFARVSGSTSNGLLALQITTTLFVLAFGPASWLSHYKPDFYWWFVFAHYLAFCLFLVLALGWTLATRTMVKTT
jgi:hypothetical protein